MIPNLFYIIVPSYGGDHAQPVFQKSIR
ncbi:hypothetical protein T191209_111 [Synechococcus phage S-CAM22]|uniref:Uncharacterized protein n=1 Tax=Synechococcus phage S-CAM22 TaxID=1883365 RepID=A0A1D8KRQ1_9CAUD|nr:hypothetical protein BOW88_gp120 [Synechococcus phage S-CAM22]YP_010088772.1 hypothetical protein KNT15_gp120 [Synechococcus phage S-CAM22]AOV60943.1 hypothetical protein C350210_111 [Synechococcus phage S-CAM22]AOV61157.1 hypothetical protein N440310_111 [Synechococcus phage S-CAM22]AOV61371.1 hypothetical protein T191209_111 [Synechococcus phage S-CAM22]